MHMLAARYGTLSAGKVYVSELRPDFRARCLGSITANASYRADGTVICTQNVTADGSPSARSEHIHIPPGYSSFPSGHAQTSFVFSTFASLYALWCLHGHQARGSCYCRFA